MLEDTINTSTYNHRFYKRKTKDKGNNMMVPEIVYNNVCTKRAYMNGRILRFTCAKSDEGWG